MKSRILAVLVLVLVAVVGCKSKETTSAMLHNDAGRPDLAIETAKQGLEKDPNDAEAYFQLGVAYSQLDSVGLAYEHFTRAAELDPSRQELANDNIQSNFAKHYNVALNLSRDEDLQGAAKEFKKATMADPRQAKGFFMLGSAYERLGEEDPSYYPQAIEALDVVLEIATPADKQYVDALGLAGQVLAMMGKPEEAISRFNRLVEEDPTNYRMIEKIGYDLLDAQDWAGAAVFLELSASARSKIGAEDFNLYYNLGVANFQSGRRQGDQPADLEVLERAIGYYEQALVLQPDEPQTVFNVVVAYSAAKDWPRVVAWGEKYVSINAENAQAWRLMSRAYNETGNDAKARECASRYEQLQQ